MIKLIQNNQLFSLSVHILLQKIIYLFCSFIANNIVFLSYNYLNRQIQAIIYIILILTCMLDKCLMSVAFINHLYNRVKGNYFFLKWIVKIVQPRVNMVWALGKINFVLWAHSIFFHFICSIYKWGSHFHFCFLEKIKKWIKKANCIVFNRKIFGR